MPFLADIVISGSHSDVDEVMPMIEALSAALEEGWRSRWTVIAGDDDLDDEPDDPETGESDEAVDRSVLDHRILGFPGGARLLVVLDGEGLAFEEALLAAAALGRHVTSWSPGLLECVVEQVKVSLLDEPYDEENWLPPIRDDDEREAPRWPLAELMDVTLQSLAARYLLAGGVRSLWSPARQVNGSVLDARDVALGAAEDPWGRELVTALGALLIQAARWEAASGQRARLVLSEGGDPELAAELLRRTRATVDQDVDDDWEDDEDTAWHRDTLHGHGLLEAFTEEHDLAWSQIPDGESPEHTEARSAEQLRRLMWAGMNTLATLCSELRSVSNPWQLLAELDKDDSAVAVFAEAETERLDAARAEDAEAIRGAAYAHAAVWVAIRRPDIMDTADGARLVERVTRQVTAFHMVAYDALIMLEPELVRMALDDALVEPVVVPAMRDFLQALEITCREEGAIEGKADAYDDMHRALGAALGDDDEDDADYGDDDDYFDDQTADLAPRVRSVLRIVGVAAALTSTDANPRRGESDHISAPEELSRELLAHAGEFATLMLHDDQDEDQVARMSALAVVATVDAVAAGEMAVELPDLSGPDPRTEPAARERALRWVADALQLTGERGTTDVTAAVADAATLPEDVRTLLAALTAGQQPQEDWPVHRLVAASACTASRLLAAVDQHEPDRAFEVFRAE